MKGKFVAVVTACFLAGGAWAHGDDKARGKAAKGHAQSKSADSKKEGHAGHEKGKHGSKSEHGKKEEAK